MLVTHIKFNEVRLYTHKSGKCVCGLDVTRKKKFTQTINPFNKNENGTIKTREEILIELQAEAELWKAIPIRHERCE